MKKNELLSKDREALEAAIDAYNKALKADKLDELTKAETAIKEGEQQYALDKMTAEFDEFIKTENPMRAAVEKHHYYVLGHKIERVDGVVTGCSIVEDKIKQVDLLRFCKYAKLDSKWQYTVEKFNKLLTLRLAKELKLKPAQIKAIDDSFAMNSMAKDIEMGATPTSNTQICKQLQMCIDGILFEDDGKGKNTIKCNSHDVAYMLACFSKRSNRKVLTVSTAKSGFVNNLVGDVMYRIVNGLTYSVDCKLKSND